jgi:hypothetical protein
MDEVSVTRTSTPSTRAIVADEGLCGQVAALLLCDRGPTHDAFSGEPVEEVLQVVRWALSHEADEGFDPAEVLTSWARTRGWGVERQAAAPGAGPLRGAGPCSRKVLEGASGGADRPT